MEAMEEVAVVGADEAAGAAVATVALAVSTGPRVGPRVVPLLHQPGVLLVAGVS